MKVTRGQIDSLANVMEVLQEIFDLDFMISIADREKFVKYMPGRTVDVEVVENSVIPEGDPLYASMKSRKQITAIVPREVYGVVFKAICTPLENDLGEVIGSVGVGINIEREKELEDMATNLAAVIQQVTASVDEVSSSAQRIAGISGNLEKSFVSAKENTQNTDKILKYIREISDQTNLLGLNAAIEAARAGEHGRGFAVVAEEIRRLSLETKKSAEEVYSVLTSINESVNSIMSAINITKEATGEQAATIEQIQSAIQEINATAQELSSIADIGK